jgi:hypothetical protein
VPPRRFHHRHIAKHRISTIAEFVTNGFELGSNAEGLKGILLRQRLRRSVASFSIWIQPKLRQESKAEAIRPHPAVRTYRMAAKLNAKSMVRAPPERALIGA